MELTAKRILLVMKLTVFLLMVFLIQVHASGLGQSVTLSGQSLSVKEVFAAIRQQTGYVVFANEEIFRRAKPVTIEARNEPLTSFLDKVMASQPFDYHINSRTIIVSLKPDKEEKKTAPKDFYAGPALVVPVRIVQGRVTDSTGNPLAGVAIKVKGTKTGTATAEDGSFSLAGIDPDKATLIISYIGYRQQEIALQGQTNISVVLKIEVNELDEMTINTGYQKLKPNEVNGSYVVIDNKMLNQQTGTNILDRLNGVTSSLLFNVGKSNLNPQNTTGITIRGLSTINGPLDPLIVVDNFVYNGDINNINPNDVESVTVLKDAAATSIWGARAGNGVIVITTKKGKFNQKLQVDFNSDIILTDKPDLYYTPQISSSDYIDFEQELFNQGFYNSDISSVYRTALSPAVEVFLARQSGQISAADSAAQIDAFKKTDNRKAFNKYYSKEGITQQYALNLRGGSQSLAWLLSGTFDKDVDNLKTEFNKINLRFENTYKPVKNLQLNVGVYYTTSNNISGKPNYNTVSSINGTRYIPYLPLAGPNGEDIPSTYQYRRGYIDTAGAGKLLDWNYYPLSEWRHSRTRSKVEDLIAHIGVQYRITNGLDFSIQYQYERQRSDSRITWDTSSYNARNMINLFSQIDHTTGNVEYIVPLGDIIFQNGSNEYTQNLRGQLNFDKSFHTKHRITAIAGMEAQASSIDGLGSYYYGYNADPLSYAIIDPLGYYPTYVTGYDGQLAGGISFSQTYYRLLSFYGNASYIYNQRYIVSASLRKDGSNIFGANTNDKWKPLWSAGLGWKISKENFYRSRLLPYLKLSATMGYSGNVDLSKSALAIGGSGNNSSTGLPYIRIHNLNNPDLKWEEAYQLNLRLEFKAIKNALSGSVEYYYKKGTDLYGQTPFDYTTWGFNNVVTKNVAAMSGKGIDINLHSNNIRGVLKWTTDFWYSFNTDKTMAYYTSNSGEVASLIGHGNMITPVVGKPLYAIAAYKWGGLDDLGNPQGYLNNTLSEDYIGIQKESFNQGLSGGSFRYIGSSSPTSFGSLMNEFSFKGFTLSFNITYKLGYYLFKPALSYYALANNGGGGINYDKRWQQPGDENNTNIPSFVYPINASRGGFYGNSEINVIKGDHIRLQFANLAYSISTGKRKLPFKSLQLYINAANLGTLWRANHDHIDPDYVGGIPAPKSYTIGIKTNF